MATRRTQISELAIFKQSQHTDLLIRAANNLNGWDIQASPLRYQGLYTLTVQSKGKHLILQPISHHQVLSHKPAVLAPFYLK